MANPRPTLVSTVGVKLRSGYGLGMVDRAQPDRVKAKVAGQYERLEQSRRLGPFVSLGKRFVEIDGDTYAGLLAIELFTTVLPLVIIGYSYFSGFSDNASVGTIFSRQLGLNSSQSEVVRSAFGTSAGLKSTWTIVGLFGFLIWGVPMSITVAGMYAKAWRRPAFDIVPRILRASAWFLLYLVTLSARERILSTAQVGFLGRLPFFALSLIPTWLFWSFSPVLLVKDGARGKKFLLLAGLAGVIIDGVLLVPASRIVFPMLLDGWTQFGPIGVSMTIMTWVGVMGFAWVITACAGAIVWERNAPATTVVDAQVDRPAEPENA
jgi:hypothetical protein